MEAIIHTDPCADTAAIDTWDCNSIAWIVKGRTRTVAGPSLYFFRRCSKLKCRSCHSTRLVRLDKKETNDHDVYRCRACGHLFSPADSPGPVSAPPSRTVAVRPGYRTRER